MIKHKVIFITDGDKVAKNAVEVVARRVGGRCISRSAGNPTPISGQMLVELIKIAASDPVLVMFDDCGQGGEGKGERALRYVATHPEIDVLGAVAVASNCSADESTRVDIAIDLYGNVVYHAVDKKGYEHLDQPLRIHGDTVGILSEIDIPIIVGVGDIGKMKDRDSWEIGAPVTMKAVEMILSYHN